MCRQNKQVVSCHLKMILLREEKNVQVKRSVEHLHGSITVAQGLSKKAKQIRWTLRSKLDGQELS